MREPIREPAPEGTPAERRPEPLRYTGPAAFTSAAPYSAPGLVEWAPTWGGMFVALAILILLSSLGVAIGIGTGATAAGIWGAISVIIGFFVGGWFTGRTLDVLDQLIATAHGILVWAVAMIFTIVFTIVAAIAGINTLTNVARVTVIGNFVNVLGGGAAPGAAAAASSTAVVSSWVAFIVLLLSLIAAIAGAIVGNRGRFTETTRS
jgi:hypothetical protein